LGKERVFLRRECLKVESVGSEVRSVWLSKCIEKNDCNFRGDKRTQH